MNWLDILLTVIVVASTIHAIRRGFVRTALSLAGLVAGVTLAGRYFLILAQTASGNSVPPLTVEAACWLGVLLAIILLCAVLAHFIEKAVHFVGLSWLNRLLGGVVGFVRGYVFGVAVLIAVIAFLPRDQVLAASSLGRYFLPPSGAVFFSMPSGTLSQLPEALRDLPARLRSHGTQTGH